MCGCVKLYHKKGNKLYNTVILITASTHYYAQALTLYIDLSKRTLTLYIDLSKGMILRANHYSL